MLIENYIGDNKSLVKESLEAMEYFPNQAIFYFFNGVANYNLQHYDKAIEMLEMSLDFVNNIELKKQTYTYLGESYYRIDELNTGFSFFDKALLLDKNDIYILNNYSYYLALKKMHLEKASEMMERCLSIDSLNSSYLDTYSWVLFNMKQYKDALHFVEKAIENGGDKSEVIIEHYGDILFKSGKKDKAILNWKKSKELGNNSEILEQKILSENLSDDVD